MNEHIQKALQQARREAPPLESVATEHRLPIDGGDIRLLHARPAKPSAARPVVMIPGFGVLPPGWHDWWSVLHERAEVFYIETREKPTSTLQEGADLSMDALVRDIAAGLSYFGLDGTDYVLQGTSWGSTAMLAGLSAGAFSAETVLAWNIVPHMHFNRWALRNVTPRLPFWIIGALRDVLGGIVLSGMEANQRARLMSFIQVADWRWKDAAEAQVDFELADIAASISQEILLVVGVDEKVHSADASAEIAARMPRGRLLAPGVPSTDNTLLGGVFALELARQSSADPLPPLLAGVERSLSDRRASRPTPPG